MKISHAIVGALVLSVAVAAAGQTAIGDLTATDASVKGAVSVSASGTRVLSGSSISAGQSRASVRLERGGTLDICPRTSLSITSSEKGGELLLALGEGAVETHYELGAVADSIVTPDFRIMLAGPGKFHFAISSDLRGDTCVRSLAGNAASAIVYEQMGQGIYQVQPGGQVLFHDGTVEKPETMVPPNCGCPAPKAVPGGETKLLAPLISSPAASNLTATDNVTVQVDAPFVFRAEEPKVPPPPQVARLESRRLPPVLLRVRALPPPKPLPKAKKAETAAPPAESAKPQHKGLFQRIRNWFTGKSSEPDTDK